MYATPSHICLTNKIQSRSVNVKSSATTRSNSSPPVMLQLEIDSLVSDFLIKFQSNCILCSQFHLLFHHHNDFPGTLK